MADKIAPDEREALLWCQKCRDIVFQTITKVYRESHCSPYRCEKGHLNKSPKGDYSTATNPHMQGHKA